MEPSTLAYLAKMGTFASIAIVSSVIFMALRATWQDSPKFRETVAQFRREHVLPTLGCFSVLIVTIGFLMGTLPNH